MEHQIHISEEELAELERMLGKEAAERRNELRRTRNPSFREDLIHRLDLLDHMHERITSELHGSKAPAA